MSETNDTLPDLEKAVQYPKIAQDIQQFCFKNFQKMPTTISTTPDEDPQFFVCGPARTFILFLNVKQEDGSFKHELSLSLMGDVAQSAMIAIELVNYIGYDKVVFANPFCENAETGQVAFNDQAYVVMMNNRRLEALHNIQMAQHAAQQERENASSIVGLDGEALSKDEAPKIIT